MTGRGLPDRTEQPYILVVGAGPTGLLAACELLRRGVRVRLIDKATEPTRVPKALSVWPRAMDIMTDLGVAEQFRQASVRVDSFNYFSERKLLASIRFSPELASRQLPQYETERILTERLHALGGRIERGVRLLGLDETDLSRAIDGTDGVTATLEHPDGSVRRIRPSFVIGADGAGSDVRGQLGIGLQGSTYETAFALIDTHIDGDLPSNEVSYYQTQAGTLAVIPQPDGVFRFLSLMPGNTRMTVPLMQSIVDERGPRDVRLTTPVWQTVIRVHARHATSFQRGRVFLVGDAAHTHSPAGGQGMNNGFQDAYNLAWKLAAVLHGESPSTLLLDYSRERLEATRRIVRDTDVHTRAWLVRGRTRVFLRDAAFRTLDRTGVATRFYTPVLAGRRLHYTPYRTTQSPARPARCAVRAKLPGGVRVGSVLPREAVVGRDVGVDPQAWLIAVTAPPDGGAWLARVDSIAARWPRVLVARLAAMGSVCVRPGYYLVRPDGHIAAHGHDGDLDRLETELGLALIPAQGDAGGERHYASRATAKA